MKGTLLFSDYVDKVCKRPRDDLRSMGLKNATLSTWFELLVETLAISQRYFPRVPTTKLFTNFRDSVCAEYAYNWPLEKIDERIKNLDQRTWIVHTKLVDLANAYTYFNVEARIQSVVSFVPSDRRGYGVSVFAYVVTDSNQYLPICIPTSHSSNYYQHRENETRRTEYLNMRNGLTTSCLRCAAVTHIRTKSENNFHAEDHWFSVYLPDLLDILTELKSSGQSLDNQMDDNLCLAQVSAVPRIEFVSSTEPCQDCWMLFASLRVLLNSRQIYLPMAVYFDKPCNTAMIDRSLSVIRFDGKVEPVFLHTTMPHVMNCQRERKKLWKRAAMSIYNTVICSEYRTFARLNKVVLNQLSTMAARPFRLGIMCLVEYLVISIIGLEEGQGFESTQMTAPPSFDVIRWLMHFLRRLQSVYPSKMTNRLLTHVFLSKAAKRGVSLFDVLDKTAIMNAQEPSEFDFEQFIIELDLGFDSLLQDQNYYGSEALTLTTFVPIPDPHMIDETKRIQWEEDEENGVEHDEEDECDVYFDENEDWGCDQEEYQAKYMCIFSPRY